MQQKINSRKIQSQQNIDFVRASGVDLAREDQMLYLSDLTKFLVEKVDNTVLVIASSQMGRNRLNLLDNFCCQKSKRIKFRFQHKYHQRLYICSRFDRSTNQHISMKMLLNLVGDVYSKFIYTKNTTMPRGAYKLLLYTKVSDILSTESCNSKTNFPNK